MIKNLSSFPYPGQYLWTVTWSSWVTGPGPEYWPRTPWTIYRCLPKCYARITSLHQSVWFNTSTKMSMASIHRILECPR